MTDQNIDGLLGCFNRRKFDEDVEAEIVRANRYERSLSVLMIGIDWFKRYKDFHGDARGDALLKEMVDVLSRNVRVMDRVYRHGGEELSILLPETGREKALATAERLQNLIEQKQFEGEQDSQPHRKVTVSIGVASYPWDAIFKDDLLKSAQAALDLARRSGGNRVSVFCSQNMKSSSS